MVSTTPSYQVCGGSFISLIDFQDQLKGENRMPRAWRGYCSRCENMANTIVQLRGPWAKSRARPVSGNKIV
jgi:hypothetical protein